MSGYRRLLLLQRLPAGPLERHGRHGGEQRRRAAGPAAEGGQSPGRGDILYEVALAVQRNQLQHYIFHFNGI